MSTTKKKVINLMMDMETLGTRSNSVVLSIALVPFAIPAWAGFGVDNFYVVINSSQSVACGFTTDKHTVDWWEKQDELARKEAFSGTTAPVDALSFVTSYIEKLKYVYQCDVTIWSRGQDFDMGLLNDMYDIFKVTKPYKYNCGRDLRTLIELAGINEDSIPFAGVKHSALADAMHQAKVAEACFTMLGYYP